MTTISRKYEETRLFHIVFDVEWGPAMQQDPRSSKTVSVHEY